ncbi:TetR/AcrR family transcriptional regulator [Furfurilactobacillus milii]|uniref:TetR family transcriptional regulator n=1 Tax=Furfurilactobacillus milii TaxID=2888272 RepID=A0A6N9I215_9LACO|nr:TetR/AcrR family transcriptional regulator [Furfurilactobacillus milii]MYV16859.1 TetR family transcriptional regulator [Furfurilactobacillus milii]
MRGRDETKRARILQATSQIMMNEGIAAVSLSKIAKEAGIASGTLYTYFEDKNDMLKALYLDRKADVARVITAFDPNGDPTAELDKFMSLVYGYAQHHLENMLLIREFNQSPILKQLGITAEESYLGYEPIQQLTQNGVANGIFVPVTFEVLMSYAYTPVIEYVVALNNGLINEQDVPFDRIKMLSCRAILINPRS